MKKKTILIASKPDTDRDNMVKMLAGHGDFVIAKITDSEYDIVWSAMRSPSDVMVMDSVLAGEEILRLVPAIKTHSPESALIFLCHPDKPPTLEQVLKAGVSGYLIRGLDTANLVSAVNCALSGGLYINQTLRSYVPNFFAPHSTMLAKNKSLPEKVGIPYTIMSKTEKQIIHGILTGYSDREIAKNLNISLGCVRNCVCQARKKVSQKNRTQLGIYALSKGLLQWEDTFIGEGETKAEEPAAPEIRLVTGGSYKFRGSGV